jgi:hypothetical protein
VDVDLRPDPPATFDPFHEDYRLCHFLQHGKHVVGVCQEEIRLRDLAPDRAGVDSGLVLYRAGFVGFVFCALVQVLEDVFVLGVVADIHHEVYWLLLGDFLEDGTEELFLFELLRHDF